MSLLVTLPGALSLPLVLIVVLLFGILWIAALIGAVTSEFKDGITKLIWVLIILFGSLLGTLLWFAIGRSQTIQSRRV